MLGVGGPGNGEMGKKFNSIHLRRLIKLILYRAFFRKEFGHVYALVKSTFYTGDRPEYTVMVIEDENKIDAKTTPSKQVETSLL